MIRKNNDIKICYFGIYDTKYSRNKILISGLRKNGVTVVECRTNRRGVGKYFELMTLHWNLRKNYDVMIVGYPGFQACILARFLTRKPIILDAFVSLYDSMVLDRRLVPAQSLRARYYWMLDKISMLCADGILFDTEEHIRYAVREFSVPHEKFKRIFLGADIDLFYPREVAAHAPFKVLFFGTFIPLQGVEYIIRAAKLLEGEQRVQFDIIGGGQEKEKMVQLSRSLQTSNVLFSQSVPLEELPARIAHADVCLGIFGDTQKARRVIPNKVYECVAMRKPVVTMRSSAASELFTDSDLFFVEAGNPEEIASIVVAIMADPKKAEIVAGRGYETLLKRATPTIIGQELKEYCKRLCVSKHLVATSRV